MSSLECFFYSPISQFDIIVKLHTHNMVKEEILTGRPYFMANKIY